MDYGTFQAPERSDNAAASPWKPAPRPDWVRSVNEIGRGLEAGAEIRLDADSLMEQARARTGLSDFGDEDFLEPLHVLTRSLVEEAELNFVGRLIARDEILSSLAGRLAIFDAVGRHPEILEQEIREPVFIAGAGRTGTTLLQELLARDEGHRTPLGWEVREPAPPADEAPSAREARIDRADDAISIWQRVTPEIEAMHAMGGRLAAECGVIFNHAFASPYFPFSYNVPSYSRWLGSADKAPVYRYHRKFLQVLQWLEPGRRWILKLANHIGDIEALLAVYPDARMINTHRDPLKVLASLAGFYGTMVWMRSDRLPDVHGVMQATSAGLAALLERTLERRREGILRDEILFEMRYTDLLADPIGTLGRIYDHFGWPFSDEARSEMRSYLKRHPQGSRGRYVYSFEDTGLDPETERRSFTAYRELYGIPNEI